MDNDLIWDAVLDEKYTIEVRRVSDYIGELTITEKEVIIYKCKVPLMYGAVFGPDSDDIMTWQKIVEDVVDKLK